MTGNARIINVSSLSHAFLPDPIDIVAGIKQKEYERGVDRTINDDESTLRLYPKLSGYECSKLAVVLHAKALTARLTGNT